MLHHVVLMFLLWVQTENPVMADLFPVDVLEGSAANLTCDMADNVTVTWYRDEQIIHTDSFNASDTANATRERSSVLTLTFSRGDNGTEIRCEAEQDAGPHGHKLLLLNKTHLINVHYPPEMNVSATDMYVGVGDGVTLRCEAEGNPTLDFHWSRNGVTMNETEQVIHVTNVNTNTRYTCTARNSLAEVSHEFRVHVTEDKTTTRPDTQTGCPLTVKPEEIVVRFGDVASVNCSSWVPDVAGMGWEAPFGGTGFENALSVTWTVQHLEDWTIKPMCYVTLKNNHQCSVVPTVRLYKTPDSVSISSSRLSQMVEGQEQELMCNISNVAPVQNLTVAWYRGDQRVRTETFTETSVTPVNVSSTYTMTPQGADNGVLFGCQAELHLGPNGPKTIPKMSSTAAAVVYYEPTMHDCPSHYVAVEREFRLDMLPCKAEGNPPPEVHWYHLGELVNQSEPLTRNQSGEYTAEIMNTLSRSATSVNITIEYSPSLTCQDLYVVKQNDEVRTLCELEGKPKPAVTWFQGGKELVSSRRWTKHDSGEYVVRAANKHGTANHTIRLNVWYAPMLEEGNYSREVTPGENVTFGCRAVGNPAPEILWRYTPAVNAKESTRGHEKNISVTEATSTNAGVYICVATNEVGTVSRSVTLMLTDRSLSSFYWWLLVLFGLVVIVLLLVVFLWKRRKEHGQYSFVPNHTTQSSSIPLTSRSGGGPV